MVPNATGESGASTPVLDIMTEGMSCRPLYVTYTICGGPTVVACRPRNVMPANYQYAFIGQHK